MDNLISPGFILLIDGLKKTLFRNFFYCLFILIVFSVMIFMTGNIDRSVFVSEILMIVSLGFIQYSQIIPKGKTINNTITGINISGDNLSLTTAPFQFLFWFNAPPKVLTIKINKSFFREGSYPLKSIYDLDENVLIVTTEKFELYLLYDFFESGLKEAMLRLRT